MAETMADNRAAPRKKVLKGGKIVFKRGQSVIDCTVRDLSRTGARLQVASVVGIPDAFNFVLPGFATQPCRVVWRRLKELGVVFEKS